MLVSGVQVNAMSLMAEECCLIQWLGRDGKIDRVGMGEGAGRSFRERNGSGRWAMCELDFCWDFL